MSLRCAAWIAEFYRLASGVPRLNEAIAVRRAETCVGCPKNVEWREGCGSCIESVSRLSFVWKGNLGTPLDNRLYACAVTGQKNDCAVWTDALPPLSAEQTARLPGNCWRKRT